MWVQVEFRFLDDKDMPTPAFEVCDQRQRLENPGPGACLLDVEIRSCLVRKNDPRVLVGLSHRFHGEPREELLEASLDTEIALTAVGRSQAQAVQQRSRRATVKRTVDIGGAGDAGRPTPNV